MMDEDTSDLEEKKPKKELQEKDFIQESYKKNPMTLWISLAITAGVITFCWGVGSWYYDTMSSQLEESPFLQVTNRDMSVFLWQFPEKMPQNVKNKTSYLPGIEYQQRVGVKIESADKYVVAPPELLFLYHTWDRLLRDEFIERPIPIIEFVEFLEVQPEWKPEFWEESTEDYRLLVENLPQSTQENLQTLPKETLPTIVRQAFEGWKNYRYEGDLINKMEVDYSTLTMFLNSYPNYARNFWRNIVEADYPKYLEAYTLGKYSREEKVPKEQLTPFLRVALFNFIQAKKGQ